VARYQVKYHRDVMDGMRVLYVGGTILDEKQYARVPPGQQDRVVLIEDEPAKPAEPEPVAAAPAPAPKEHPRTTRTFGGSPPIRGMVEGT
jgi:hypothetical protein